MKNKNFPILPQNISYDFALGEASGIVKRKKSRKKYYVEIAGTEYLIKDDRKYIYFVKYPLEKFIGKTIHFKFFPTSKYVREYKFTLKMINLLKEKKTQIYSYIEIAGTVLKRLKKHLLIEVLSNVKNKRYYCSCKLSNKYNHLKIEEGSRIKAVATLSKKTILITKIIKKI